MIQFSSLKPGDEVGLTWESWGGPTESVALVEAIEEDGCIRLEGRELPFWPDDGREMELVVNGVVSPSPNDTRLCEPTDAGRANSLCEDIQGHLDELGLSRRNLSLDQLRRLDAALRALLAETLNQQPE